MGGGRYEIDFVLKLYVEKWCLTLFYVFLLRVFLMIKDLFVRAGVRLCVRFFEEGFSLGSFVSSGLLLVFAGRL